MNMGPPNFRARDSHWCRKQARDSRLSSKWGVRADTFKFTFLPWAWHLR